MAAALRSSRTRREKRRFLSDGAMAIDAIDFYRRARLAVDFSVAVVVLRKVAVVTLHSFFKMDVGKVHGFPEAVRVVVSDLSAGFVEPIPLTVVVENSAEDPPVAVEVRKLSGFQLLVEFRAPGFFKKLLVAPEATNCGSFRISHKRLVALFLGRIALLVRIHPVAVNFVVPPGEAEIGGDHVGAGVDVADHALAGGDGAREGVFEGMARLVFPDRGIARITDAGVPESRVSAGMRRVAVVGVNNMACRAATGAVVAWMIV